MVSLYVASQILFWILGFFVIRRHASWVELYIFVSMCIFNSIGAFYYLFDGGAYYVPSANTFVYLYFSFVIFTFSLVFSSKIKLAHEKKILNEDKFRLIILGFVSFIPFLYIIIFRDGFIFYKAILGMEFSEKDRPDVVGNMPMYYTFTVWVSSLSQPILVALIRYTKSRAIKLLFIILLIMLCLSIGSKSALMMISVYFYLTWKTSYFNKLKWGIYTATFLFSFYFTMKVIYVPHVLENENVALLILDSLFRRVSVINYSIASFVFEYFVLSKAHLPEGFTHLKQFVFYSIYGYLPGGAPVPLYMQGFYLYRELLLSLLYSFLISFFLVAVFKMALNGVKGVYFEIIRFLVFYGIILMSMGFVEDVLIRSVLPITIFYVLCNLPKLRFSDRFAF